MAKRANRGKVVVDSRVEIYRDPEQSHGVYARKEGEATHLGVRDGTVSRLRDETPPIVIEPYESYIEVYNRRNSNDITVQSDGGCTKLTTGNAETVSSDTEIEIGYQTTLVMTAEKETKVKQVFEGAVRGDVVAGDQTNVDDRTQVIDSVVNRSEIGDDGSGTVEDSAVNRLQVGGSGRSSNSDTKKHCEKHNRVYAAETCPECRTAQPSGAGPTEAKFCRYCGAKIPAAAAVCPDCENELGN